MWTNRNKFKCIEKWLNCCCTRCQSNGEAVDIIAGSALCWLKCDCVNYINSIENVIRFFYGFDSFIFIILYSVRFLNFRRLVHLLHRTMNYFHPRRKYKYISIDLNWIWICRVRIPFGNVLLLVVVVPNSNVKPYVEKEEENTGKRTWMKRLWSGMRLNALNEE